MIILFHACYGFVTQNFFPVRMGLQSFMIRPCRAHLQIRTESRPSEVVWPAEAWLQGEDNALKLVPSEDVILRVRISYSTRVKNNNNYWGQARLQKQACAWEAEN